MIDELPTPPPSKPLERRLNGIPNTGLKIDRVSVEVTPQDWFEGKSFQRFTITIEGKAPDRASIQRLLRWAASELMDRAG